MKKLIIVLIVAAAALAVWRPGYYRWACRRLTGSPHSRAPRSRKMRGSRKVYVPRNGRYYHRKGCPRTAGTSAVPTPLVTARELFAPCPVCRPPR